MIVDKISNMRTFGLIIAAVLISTNLSAQNDKFEFNGYLKNLQTGIYPEDHTLMQNELITDNLLHNRLNFAYYPDAKWSLVLQGRNRFMYGEMVKLMNSFTATTGESYAEMLSQDNGFFDLSESILSDNGYILHTMVDRMYVDFVSGQWQVRAGRQRLNWGISMVWNPNDIFNTFNYFDFDYEERPGTDALKVQYYTGAASSAELVWQAGKNWDEMALGALYRFNKFGFDWQVLGGYMRDDAVFGAGWSGNIGGAGFRGEATWFQHKGNFADTAGQIVASVSADYMFDNSLYLSTGLLFNNQGTTGKAARPLLFINNQDLSAKTLTPSKTELFFQISYPFTPLLSADFSAIVNPFDGSWYSGPALTYSLAQNIDAMLSSQLFFGDKGTEYGDVGQLFYLRIKWSF